MIVIGRLHVGAVLPEWLMAWEELHKPATADGKPDYIIYSATRQVVHCARNDIVKFTLEQHPDATHLFFIDDDVCLPREGLLRLLRESIEHDIPIVSGLYVMRDTPLLPVVYRAMDGGHHVNVTRFCAGLQEVDGVGAGCLLIRTDVLRAIRDAGEPCFDWSLGMSEDLAFCTRARRLGYRIALDADVRCEHLTIAKVTYEAFAARQAQGIAYVTAEIEHASTQVIPWAS